MIGETWTPRKTQVKSQLKVFDWTDERASSGPPLELLRTLYLKKYGTHLIGATQETTRGLGAKKTMMGVWFKTNVGDG